MTRKGPEILIYGIGNPGRQDDALGILLAEKIEQWAAELCYSFITVEQCYQLNIEDAELISHYDLVIFLDASVKEEITDISIERVTPHLKTDFNMHSVTPAFVAGLSENIYSRIPEIFQLHIKASKFNFMEPLTGEAAENLDRAFIHLKEFIIAWLARKKSGTS